MFCNYKLQIDVNVEISNVLNFRDDAEIFKVQ
jgi:hypothetical protein